MLCARLCPVTLMSNTSHLENLLSVAAVDVALMDVNLAMRSKTLRFWTTSSRVGQMHSACVHLHVIARFREQLSRSRVRAWLVC